MVSLQKYFHKLNKGLEFGENQISFHRNGANAIPQNHKLNNEPKQFRAFKPSSQLRHP